MFFCHQLITMLLIVVCFLLLSTFSVINEVITLGFLFFFFFSFPSRWKSFKRQMLSMRAHSDSKGFELKRPSDSIYTFPCPDCMCRTNRTEDSKPSSPTWFAWRFLWWWVFLVPVVLISSTDPPFQRWNSFIFYRPLVERANPQFWELWGFCSEVILIWFLTRDWIVGESFILFCIGYWRRTEQLSISLSISEVSGPWLSNCFIFKAAAAVSNKLRIDTTFLHTLVFWAL